MANYSVPSDGLDLTSYVEKPGWYHCLIKAIDENPIGNNGAMNAIRVRGVVLQGTDSSQIKREFSQLLSNPNMSHKDQGAFATKVHLRLARAAGILPQVQPGQGVEINWQQAIGKQIVAQFSWQKGNDDVERIQINGAHFYHVTDEEVSAHPKDAAALKLMGINGGSSSPGGQIAATVATVQHQVVQQQQPQPAAAWGDL